jgi:hypothetical protein
MAALNPNQRSVLRYTTANDGTTLNDMSAAIAEGKNSTIAGLWTGITRNADKLGIKMSQLIRRDAKGSGRNRVIRYFPGPLLRANEVPDA